MQEHVPATADEAVLMLYTYASRHAQQLLTRLYLLSPAMGDELVALWRREHAQTTLPMQAYGFLRGIGRWSYQKPVDGSGGAVGFQGLPAGLPEADYLAIAEYMQQVDSSQHSAFESALQEVFLAACETLQHVLPVAMTSGEKAAFPSPSVFHNAYLGLALALADMTYQAVLCFAREGSAREWETWMTHLREKKVDINLALLVCHLTYRYRARGGVQGVDERLHLSRALELPYRYDTVAQAWCYADIPYPALPDALTAWHEHSCPTGGRMACTCERGYLCKGCYNQRLVEGSALLRIERRGVRCIRCWTAESTEGVAALLDQE